MSLTEILAAAMRQQEDIQRELGAHQSEVQRLMGLALINQGRIEVLQQLVSEGYLAPDEVTGA